MPELKRNFIKGRMNKDLDERLVPIVEYRDALNIQVSTSEGSNVGTAQNIKGNLIGPIFGEQPRDVFVGIPIVSTDSNLQINKDDLSFLSKDILVTTFPNNLSFVSFKIFSANFFWLSFK